MSTGRSTHNANSLVAVKSSPSDRAQERVSTTVAKSGCACGDGVIDWKKVIQIIRKD